MLQRAEHLRLGHRLYFYRHRPRVGQSQGPEVGGWYRENVLVAARGRTVLLAAIVSLTAACSAASPENPQVRAGAVYDTIVHWFADESANDPEPLPVFIEPRGEGASIQLDVQAELIKSAKDFATVKFIDSRDEALVTDEDGSTVVADDGILIRLAPVVEVGDKVRIDVDVHDGDEQFTTMQFNLHRVGDAWVIDGAPVEVPAG
jgi:hypothetical protein